MVDNRKYIETLKTMSDVGWDSLTDEERKEALQTIINRYFCNKYGVENPYTIEFEKLPENRMGFCDHKKKIVYIREDLATQGIEFDKKGRPIWHENPISDLVLTAFHEMRHGEQSYCLNNCKQLGDKEQMLLIKCNNKTAPNGKRTYFKSKHFEIELLGRMATCLYVLQPVECDAFEFAQYKTQEFGWHMNRLFPNAEEHKYLYIDEKFEQTKADACELFNTDDPIRDINNIILTLGGEYVHVELNPIMCRAIELTQDPFLYEILKENQARNLEIAERIELGKQFAENEEIDLEELDPQIDDAIGQYVDAPNDINTNESQETTHYDLDNLFQDITDRR